MPPSIAMHAQDDWAARNRPATGRRAQAVRYGMPLSRAKPTARPNGKPPSARNSKAACGGRRLRGQTGRKPVGVKATVKPKETRAQRSVRLHNARGTGTGSRRKIPLLPPGYLHSERPCGNSTRSVIHDPSGKKYQSMCQAKATIQLRHISFGGQSRLDERMLQAACYKLHGLLQQQPLGVGAFEARESAPPATPKHLWPVPRRG